jgi:hypothetical protein
MTVQRKQKSFVWSSVCQVDHILGDFYIKVRALAIASEQVTRSSLTAQGKKKIIIFIIAYGTQCSTATE